MIPTRRLLSVLSTLLVAGCALVPAAASAGEVPLGEAPTPPVGATSLGAVAPQRELNLHVALEPRDPAGLETFAAEVSTPGSPVYGQYLSVNGFADRFGATPAQVATVRAALQARGLAVGQASANNLSLPVEATAAEAEVAFGTTLERFRTADGRVAFANTSAPEVPAAAAPYVAGVLGLDDLNVPTGAARKRVADHSSDGSVLGSARPRTTGAAALAGGPQPCGEAIHTQTEEGSGYTADQIASAYSLTGYYATGNLGAGQTVALLELEPFLKADIDQYQACYGTHTVVEAVNVEGGPGAYENGDGGESELDIEQLIGLVPDANVVVYQGPNPSTAQIISTWVTEDRAKVMSSSWGLCEVETELAEMSTVDTLLQEAAAQGQSFFVAAGDAGATDCFESGSNENKAITVDYPGSDPFAIDVGGTRLEQPTTPPVQYIWSDGMEGGAGGGGVSAHFAMPSYQSAADPSLRTINSESSGTTCGATSGYCRQVPDVSADADPYTAYIVYDEKKWQIVGGTSAAAPVWAAFAALADASPACGGKTIGFANPALYAIGGSAYAGNFDDITSAWASGLKSNDIFDPSLPFFPGSHYDMTTGIGTPIGTTLGASLCAIANPPAPPNSPVPPAPSPEPTKSTPEVPSMEAPAAVRGHIVSSSLSGVGKGRPRLTIALAARPGARLRSIAISLPPTLKAKLSGPHARGIIVRAGLGKRLAASARGTARTIRIHLSKAQPSVKVIVRAPALTVAPKLLALVRSGRAAKLPLVVAVRESGGHVTRLPLQLEL